MSQTPEGETGRYDATTTSGPEAHETSLDELRAQVELLQEENRRLRKEYVRARTTQYHRTAIGLAIIGVVALGAGLLFPAVRDVLLILGSIGIFGALLTNYLTPERFVSAETGERIYTAEAETLSKLVNQLGLTNDRVYVPVPGNPSTRLFIPQNQSYEIPDTGALEQPLVVDVAEHERGISVIPTGIYLYTEFQRTLSGPLGNTPTLVSEQVTDALVEGFELAESVNTDLNSETGRASFELYSSVYADHNSFDNPLASFAAVTFARALEKPIEVELSEVNSNEGFAVTCRWNTENIPQD